MIVRTSSRALAVAAIAVALAPLAAHAGGSSCPSGMVAVTGGELQRGRHELRIPSFCMDRTEVTVDAYASCVEVGACKEIALACGAAATWGKRWLGAHPVNCVTWNDADIYCREHGLRLPSEEEWEWAARGGKRASTYPWGEDAPADRACWDGEGNAKGAGERRSTCAVGSNPRGRSPEGIQDLAGNVREWTSTPQGRFRVIRGGSWGDSLPAFLSSSFRGWNAPDERMELLGFRCVADLGAVARRPTPPVKASASTDEAGVMVFSEPIEVGGKPAKRPASKR